MPSRRGGLSPGGTCHAVLAARHVVEGPFAVINADDYYGPEAFQEIYSYLCSHPDSRDSYEYAMVGYLLGNTVTEHGHVARGICEETEGHFLRAVTERTHIERRGMTPAIPRTVVSHGPRFPGVPSCP